MSRSKSSPRPPPTTTTDTHPLNNIIIGANINEGENKGYVITDQYVITHAKKRRPTRLPTSFYLSENIANGWRKYCEVSGNQTYLLTEAAFIEYMQNHPLKHLQVTLDAEVPQTDLKTDIRLDMAKQELRDTLHLLDGKAPILIRNNLPKLRKALTKALSFRSSDDELDELLERARGYLQ
jgi:hypothetical protein